MNGWMDESTNGQMTNSESSLFRDEGHIVQEFNFLWDPEKFTLTYLMNGEIYELYDEQQILYPTSNYIIPSHFYCYSFFDSTH